jgi:hypothetical protein
MSVLRCVGTIPQGSLEQMMYGFDFTCFGTPLAPTQKLTRTDTGRDVTSDYMAAGSPSVMGYLVTCTKISNLIAGKQYKLEMEATIIETGNFEGAYLIIDVE